MFTRTEDTEFNNIVKIGISRQHLNRLLREEIDWKLKYALRVMKVLDFTPEIFYEELWNQELTIF